MSDNQLLTANIGIATNWKPISMIKTTALRNVFFYTCWVYKLTAAESSRMHAVQSFLK